MQEQLTRRMAGEIVVSEKPGETLRKWREIFQLSQKDLAILLKMNPSVVCDFEKGRRASPGIVTVRKFVEAMVDYDSTHGGKVVNTMAGTRTNEAIVDIREFTSGISIETVIEKIEGEVLAGSEEIIERPIYGYTMVDSLKAITTFNAFGEMYGWSNERAVFFSGVHYGRSPMIAVRAHPVKPRMVVYVKPKAVDPLAPKLADMEKIGLVKTDLDESTIVERLRYLK
ncbi:MAG: transcriptional regulator [Candidatus Thermoplasmatota archaeon]|nr:transcriptional regulator [Candidatus Thermoplasmatota archaeon]